MAERVGPERAKMLPIRHEMAKTCVLRHIAGFFLAWMGLEEFVEIKVFSNNY